MMRGTNRLGNWMAIWKEEVAVEEDEGFSPLAGGVLRGFHNFSLRHAQKRRMVALRR